MKGDIMLWRYYGRYSNRAGRGRSEGAIKGDERVKRRRRAFNERKGIRSADWGRSEDELRREKGRERKERARKERREGASEKGKKGKVRPEAGAANRRAASRVQWGQTGPTCESARGREKQGSALSIGRSRRKCPTLASHRLASAVLVGPWWVASSLHRFIRRASKLFRPDATGSSQ
jgi:hypothetical protein